MVGRRDAENSARAIDQPLVIGYGVCWLLIAIVIFLRNNPPSNGLVSLPPSVDREERPHLLPVRLWFPGDHISLLKVRGIPLAP